MSENKHTPEPWRSEGLTILDADGHIIFRMDVSFYLPEERKEAARRIVACVNRLAQFTTEQIEDFGYDLFAEDRPRLVEAQNEIHLLKKQRDELLAATEAIAINSEECLDFDECTAMLVSIDDYHKLMEAVARVKGEQ